MNESDPPPPPGEKASLFGLKVKAPHRVAWWIFVVLCIAAALWLLDSGDPEYAVKELLAGGRYAAYDPLIAQVATRNKLPPEVVKALVWRESRFQPDKVGRLGERGLMQVMEPAASEWASASGIEVFSPTDLFDARTNLEAGTWYLARAITRWNTRGEPLPFALAEYNAGHSRVKRWAAGDADARQMLLSMDFPGTKAYVADILSRAAFYQRRGDFQPKKP